MRGKLRLRLLFVFFVFKLSAQINKGNFAIGFNYGFGSEFNNRNHVFTNEFYKLQFYYRLKEIKYFQYEILVQPEVNFATHQLLNFYFVKPEDSDYLEKRAKYTQLKDIREYALNIGFLIRKPVNKYSSFYALCSVGPLITDTETERMSDGFAFADILALGFSVKQQRYQFDIRPSVRHVSNAGLGNKNSGYNTKNIELGISYSL